MGFTPFMELALGLYFAFTVYFAWSSGNYFTLPFLMLFLVGFVFTGFMSLFQAPLARFLDARRAPLLPKTVS